MDEVWSAKWWKKRLLHLSVYGSVVLGVVVSYAMSTYKEFAILGLWAILIHAGLVVGAFYGAVFRFNVIPLSIGAVYLIFGLTVLSLSALYIFYVTNYSFYKFLIESLQATGLLFAALAILMHAWIVERGGETRSS